MTPNDTCSGRTAPLTSKCCIVYSYSTNISTEYFKHGIHSPFFPLQNAVCFINLTYVVPVLFTFYIQGVLKLKNNSGAKRLTSIYCMHKASFYVPTFFVYQLQPSSCSYNITKKQTTYRVLVNSEHRYISFI